MWTGANTTRRETLAAVGTWVYTGGVEEFLHSAEGKLHRGHAIEMFGAVVDAEIEVERSKDGRRNQYVLVMKAGRQKQAHRK